MSASLNIAEEIFLRADPCSAAVIEKGLTTTYADLNRLSGKVSLRLRTLTRAAESGDRPRIGLRCRDGLAYIALALGILRSGGCLIPLAQELTGSEREELTRTLALDAVVSAASPESEWTGEGEIGFSFLPNESKGWIEGAGALEKLNPAFIRFSSGTTGAAKGVVLTHESLRQRIGTANHGLRIGPADRILWPLSMAHHFAVSIMLYLWNGAAVILPESHLPGDLLAAAKAHRATLFYAAPCHYVLLTSGSEGPVPAISPWPSLRLAVSTTASLLAETAARFASAFGVHPAQALGIMELGLPFLNHEDPEKRPGSVGRPQSGVEVEIRDRQGAPVPAGTVGELFLRGPGMFDAYVSPWRSREEVTGPGGWFHTGDMATADPEGFVTLVGRSKSVINVGGMKFFPEEVERILISHPGIHDARVFEKDHLVFGSVPVAEVVASEPGVTPSELSALCRKELARYKVPVEFSFVASVPKTPSGKTRRTGG